ncbi:MAG: hypothetical protein ABJC89_06520, partial [Acidobacteriota bacterium]
MPDTTDPRSAAFWSSLVGARLGAGQIEPDIIDEIAHHAHAVYWSARTSGRTHDDALALVEAELDDAPGLARASRAARRRRSVLPAPEPA